MNIIHIGHLEDCFDGTFMKEVTFDRPVTKAFIDFFLTKGTGEYFGDFARPFYKISISRHYLLKGVEGNTHLRLIVSRDYPEENIKRFQHDVKCYADYSEKKDAPPS